MTAPRSGFVVRSGFLLFPACQNTGRTIKSPCRPASSVQQSIKNEDFVTDTPETITYIFRFKYLDGEHVDTTRVFSVTLDERTLAVQMPPLDEYPHWTDLKYSQCPNCPLNPAEHPRCPVAVNLIPLIDFVRDTISYRKITITVESETRTYLKNTSMQEGVSSLLGMLMVTSGCPVMDKLRPMLRSHLPFATAGETAYRFLSMYMLAQYFLVKNGRAPDFKLDGLRQLFLDIQNVNQHFWERFAAANVEDASTNALVILDNLAQYAAFSLDIDEMEETEVLFKAYFAQS